MISTGTLVLLKALLTAAALLGFGFWQLANLRRLKREREARLHRASAQCERNPDTPYPGAAGASGAQHAAAIAEEQEPQDGSAAPTDAR